MAFVSKGANNFLKRIFVHNCARPWYVYVETFIPAFLKVVILASIIDMEDVMRMHATRVAAGAGSGPKRGKKHFVKVRLSAKATPAQRFFRQGLKVLLIITAPLEAAGFAWMMYSLANQFWWDWAALIEASDFCDQPIESGPTSRERGEGPIGILSGGDATPMTNSTQNRGGWSNNVFGVDLPEGFFQAYEGLTIRARSGTLNGVRLRFVINTILGNIIRESAPISVNDTDWTDLVMDAQFFVPVGGGGRINWQLVGPSVPAGVHCLRGNVAVWRTG